MTEPEGPNFVMYRGYTEDEAIRSVGPGWTPLIKTLFRYMELNKEYSCKDAKIIQVKEKFGTLRIYATGGDLYFEGVLSGLEMASSSICESCGQPGRLRDRREGRTWLLTLCDACQGMTQDDLRTKLSDTRKA